MEETNEFEINDNINTNEEDCDNIQENFKKVFQRCLEGKAVSLYDAHRAIRVCIEIYCRYKKGFNLTQTLFLESREPAISKLTRAGIDSDKIELMAEIYRKTHEFVHPDHSLVGMSKEKIREEMEIARENIKQLQRWGIDNVDAVAGLSLLYVSQDRRLKELLDNKISPDEYQTFLEEKKLGYYFSDMRKLKESMAANHIEIPTIRFKNKRDVEEYLKSKKGSSTIQVKTANYLDEYEESARKGDHKAYLWLISHYYNEKDWAKIHMYYNKLITLDDFDYNIYDADQRSLLSVVLIADRDYDEALKWLEQETSDPYSMILAGDCYWYTEDYASAIERYKLVGADKLKGQDRQLAVAESLCESDPAEALKYYNLCIEYANSDPETAQNIGDCYLKTGEIRSALSQYEKAFSINRSQSRALVIANALAQHLSYEKAREYAKKREKNNDILKQIAYWIWDYGNPFTGISWLEKYASEETDPEISEILGHHYLSQGIKSDNDNDIAKAIKWYGRCVDRIRDNEKIAPIILDYFYRHHGPEKEHGFWSSTFEKTILDNASDIDAAVEIYKKCDINSMSGLIQKMVGEWCLKNGELGEAVKWYTAYAPHDYPLVKSIADQLWECEEKLAAVTLYEVYAKNNVSITLYKLLGDYYLNSNPDKAVVWYEEYCRQSKKDNEQIIRLIVKHYNKHRAYRNALEWYKKLGDILFARGDKDAAIEQYERYSKHSREYSNIVIDLSPDCRAGDYYSEKQQWDIAFVYYKNICDYVWSKYRNRWQYEEKNVRRAIEVGEKALEACKNANLVDDLKQLRQMLGHLLYEKGDKEGAFAEYIKCVDKESVPNSKQVVFIDTYLRIVECYLTQGNVAQASDWYWSRCREYKCSDLAKRLGDVCWKKSMTQEAIKYYEEYCSIEEGTANNSFYQAAAEEYQKYVHELRNRGIVANDIVSSDEYIRFHICKLYLGKKKDSEYPSVLKRLADLYHTVGRDSQKRAVMRKVADTHRCMGNHEDACEAYTQAGVDIVDPIYQRTLGEYYFKIGKPKDALGWFEKSWRGNDAEFARCVGDLYFENKQKAIAVVWYERSLSCKADTELACRIAEYYKSKKQNDKIVELQETCFEKYGESLLDRYYVAKLGDDFYNKGLFDDAIRCYKTIKMGSSNINLRLAECYYYSGKHDKAEEELAIYTQKKVFVGDGFAMTHDGVFYIAKNNQLVVLERRLVKCVKLKTVSPSKQKSAVLYLHESASNKYPKKIVLFKKLDSNSEIVKTLEKLNDANNGRVNKKITKLKNSRAVRASKDLYENLRNGNGKKQSVGNLLGIAFVLLTGLVGIYVALAYAFADADGFTYWLPICGVPFVVSVFITRFMCKKSPLVASWMLWGTLVVQYIINFVLQCYLWLDPNDGAPCVWEFSWYGIISPVLYTCLFGLIFYVVMRKVFKNR